jgi:hypothetical protein
MFILQKQKHTICFTKYGVVDDGDWTGPVYFHIRFITKQEKKNLFILNITGKHYVYTKKTLVYEYNSIA